MFINDTENLSQAAANKANVCNKQTGKFFIRCIMAGFYIGVATILSNVSAAVLYPTYPQFGKLLSSFLFAIAIILIVFIGGELFTGDNMTMAMGAFCKKCSWLDFIKVAVLTYLGNFAGAFIFSWMFVESHASRTIMIDYYNSFIYNKLSLTPSEFLLRGILCNFCVCLAVWTGTRMKEESGKIMVMFFVIMTFVVAGFEHCIANMSTFSIGYMLLGGLDMGLVAKSMFFVTIGNLIGGVIMMALPLYLMKTEK